MKLPAYVQYVISKLEKCGYEAYCVGGCVRDYLLGQCPDDYDIATSALPEQIMQIFSSHKLLTIGIKHGTVTVILDGKPVEITAFRSESDYRDHRHPSAVGFSSNLEQDLVRRDFTINAMAYNTERGIIDMFGGKADLKAGIIRCVGNPEERFNEDGLRILRALRFASRYNFTLDRDTSDAVHRMSYLLDYISAERINAELCGILTGECYDILINYCDIIREIIPEIRPCIGFEQRSKYHDRTVYAHIAGAVAAAEPTLIYRLTMLLHDIGKPRCFFMRDGAGHFHGHAAVSRDMAQTILTRLRFPKKVISKVLFLIENHSIVMEDTERSIRRGLAKYGEENYFDLLKIHRFDNSSKAEAYRRLTLHFEGIEHSAREYLKHNAPLKMSDLEVKGGDLVKMGYKGEQIGRMLDLLLDSVLDGECKNDRQELLKRLEEINRSN